MVSRLPLPLTKSNLASWVINFSQRRMARTERSREQLRRLLARRAFHTEL